MAFIVILALVIFIKLKMPMWKSKYSEYYGQNRFYLEMNETNAVCTLFSSKKFLCDSSLMC